jgi:hypothetical protein
MTAPDPTPVEHEHTAQIDLAAAWLRDLPPHEIPQPIVPALQERFGLTAQQACEAIQEARR